MGTLAERCDHKKKPESRNYYEQDANGSTTIKMGEIHGGATKKANGGPKAVFKRT